MSCETETLEAFFAAHEHIIQICVADAKGSTPRDAGAMMFVTRDAICGTIGGGQLEFTAIERARAMLGNDVQTVEFRLPLGPEIGQCCGGRVDLALHKTDTLARTQIIDRLVEEAAMRPHIYILGCGHVGRALADQMQNLPFEIIVIDSRESELELCNARIEKRLTPLPEAEILAAPKASAFVVLTHDHGLDFMLSATALGRKDAAYVGMIGSATKRMKFESWLRQEHGDIEPADLVCPIGGNPSDDKRPSVIAALVAAEITRHLTAKRAPTRLRVISENTTR